jgi:hypothetical protein
MSPLAPIWSTPFEEAMELPAAFEGTPPVVIVAKHFASPTNRRSPEACYDLVFLRIAEKERGRYHCTVFTDLVFEFSLTRYIE